MPKFTEKIDDRIRQFIGGQKMFFTASAPKRGRVNLSPKGIDTFRCLDENTVCYLDLTGSGNETAAHVLENGRLTVMFCSFSGTPLILRLYGFTEKAKSCINLRKNGAHLRQISSRFSERARLSCCTSNRCKRRAVSEFRFMNTGKIVRR